MNGETLLEQEILASFERGEWKPVRNQKGEISRLRAAAAATLLKNKRVNIRISSRDLEGLQARAAEEGVPYQTLINLYLRDCAAKERKLSMSWKASA